MTIFDDLAIGEDHYRHNNNSSSSNDAVVGAGGIIIGSGGTATAAVAYERVALNEDGQPVDLLVHHSRGRSIFTSVVRVAWLGEGRPRELSSVKLATWSLLTTSIQEYQRGLREHSMRIVRRGILPIYVVWVLGLYVLMMNGFDVVGQVVLDFYWYGLLFILVASVMVSKHYTQQHVDRVFHPAVQTVLQELDQPLRDSGYSVTLMVDNGSWFPVIKETRSFLRFEPLRDEEKAAAAAAALAETGGAN